MLQLQDELYQLPDVNVFNLRQLKWKDHIVDNVIEILKAGEKFGITVKSITLNKEERGEDDNLEIKRTISRILEIKIVYASEKELTLIYNIPWLVGNHFYIGGNRKIAIYQLFDRPVIKRKGNIKIRTNIATIGLVRRTSRRHEFTYYLDYMSKELPLVYYLLAKDGKDTIKKNFNIGDDFQIQESKTEVTPEYYALQLDLAKALEKHQKDSYLSGYFNRKDDSEILENIQLISDVDIFSRRYMHTNNILDEFVYALTTGESDDMDYMNKRIRFTEQLVFHYICKDVHQMIIALKTGKKTRFKCNSKSILSNANKSPIVQYDYSLNPLDELAMLSRISLCGPGGFSKDNIPDYLRDVHDTMYGMVCPADTGERENCGANQYLVPTIELSDNLDFYKHHDHCINSIAISHVPFLEHDDATRLQMSSSQQRHAILLKEFDIPRIQSGVEGMYTDRTSFMFRAERDGTIVYKDDNIIIVQYINKECKAFNIGYKKLFLSVCDVYTTYFDQGDTFKEGDIIAESNYLNEGRLTIGKNLKTAVAVYYGYNYEDGIVISDALQRSGKLTSLHFLDLAFEITPNKVFENLTDDYQNYKPLPAVGDRLKKGDVYAKIKTLGGALDNFDVIFDACHEKRVTEDCIIADVKIYANKWSRKIPQFTDYIKTFIEGKQASKKQLVDVLATYLTKDELDNFVESMEIDKTEKSRSTYSIKGDSIDGVRIEITAIYERPIEVGDKLGNRHGNKGVIAKIVPEKFMPRFEDGSVAEVIINPLGIVSRMNIGQLFELHLAKSVSDLITVLKQKLQDGTSIDKLKKVILEYVKIIDCGPKKSYTAQMTKQLNDIITIEEMDELLDTFYVIQAPFESIQWAELNKAMKFTSTKYEYDCYNPPSDTGREANLDDGFVMKNIQNPIAFGDMYFIKMNHIAKDKISKRSVGPYASKTCQPIDGKGRKGGQRLGEMEVWSLASHGATENLFEMLTTKSDSIKKRNEYISHMINNEDILIDEEDSVSQSIRLFQSMLRTIGMDYPINEQE